MNPETINFYLDVLRGDKIGIFFSTSGIGKLKMIKQAKILFLIEKEKGVKFVAIQEQNRSVN